MRHSEFILKALTFWFVSRNGRFYCQLKTTIFAPTGNGCMARVCSTTGLTYYIAG